MRGLGSTGFPRLRHRAYHAGAWPQQRESTRASSVRRSTSTTSRGGLSPRRTSANARPLCLRSPPHLAAWSPASAPKLVVQVEEPGVAARPAWARRGGGDGLCPLSRRAKAPRAPSHDAPLRLRTAGTTPPPPVPSPPSLSPPCSRPAPSPPSLSLPSLPPARFPAGQPRTRPRPARSRVPACARTHTSGHHRKHLYERKRKGRWRNAPQRGLAPGPHRRRGGRADDVRSGPPQRVPPMWRARGRLCRAPLRWLPVVPSIGRVRRALPLPGWQRVNLHPRGAETGTARWAHGA